MLHHLIIIKYINNFKLLYILQNKMAENSSTDSIYAHSIAGVDVEIKSSAFLML